MSDKGEQLSLLEVVIVILISSYIRETPNSANVSVLPVSRRHRQPDKLSVFKALFHSSMFFHSSEFISCQTLATTLLLLPISAMRKVREVGEAQVLIAAVQL